MEKRLKLQKGKKQVDIIIGQDGVNQRERKEWKKKQKNDATWNYLGRFGEFGFTIVIPIVGGAILGRFLDDTYGIHPRATLVLLFAGVFIALYLFYKMILEELRHS